MNSIERDERWPDDEIVDRALAATLKRLPTPASPSTIATKARQRIRSRRLRRRATLGLTISASLLLAAIVGWGLFGRVDESSGSSQAVAEASIGRSDAEWEEEFAIALNSPPPVESFAALDRRMSATLAALGEREIGR